MKENSQTVLWNDSADPKELKEALTWGIVGATCNPIIALSAIKADKEYWIGRIKEYAKNHPTATDDQIGWAMVKELSVSAAKILEPEFDKYNGRNGRLSIQTDPRNFRDAKALADQAFEFSQLAKNIIVKIPVTSEAISAFEEATYRGVSLNATVSFSVAQTIAVAEAIERGLKRREAEGLDISQMGPVCTIMLGRVDDWVKVSVEKSGTLIDPGVMEWAGVQYSNMPTRFTSSVVIALVYCVQLLETICIGVRSSVETQLSLPHLDGSRRSITRALFLTQIALMSRLILRF
jgi:transaldolase